MIAFQNLKIFTRLIIAFGLMVILTGALAIVGIFAINNISNNYDDLITYTQRASVIMLNVQHEVMNLRRITTAVRADVEFPERQDGHANASQAAVQRIHDGMNEFIELTRVDPTLTQQERDEIIAEAQQLLAVTDLYFSELVLANIAYARAGSMERVVQNASDQGHLIAELNAIVSDMIAAEAEILAEGAELNLALVSRYTNIFIAVAIVIVLIALLLAWVVSASITKPIKQIINVAGNVAQGSFNVNLNTTAKDETGNLSKSFGIVVENVTNIADDINDMRSKHEGGLIDTRLESTKYQGAYKDISDSVNHMVNNYVVIIKDILGVLSDIAEGSFSKEMQEYNGKDMGVKVVVSDLKAKIEGVTEEINSFANAVSEGNLEHRAETGKLKGKWTEIMAGLNDIAKAVDAPLSVIKVVMGEMKAGNFDAAAVDKKISDAGYNADVTAYKGTFRDILAASGDSFGAISSYITEISDTITAVAGGDLSVSINREYVGDFSAIKDAINSISKLFHKSMSEISTASKYVLEGATKITTSSIELSDGSTAQAASLEELHSTVELMNQQTKKFADNAAEANELSNKSTSNAQEGNTAMKQMLGAMMQIKDSSNNISKIIKVIQDIAFQTNLLALNAAVEAARAGEHGKGFAVVAEEVRSLAARSQDAASETTNMINDSITRVESGTSIAEVTSVSLEAIVTSANEVMSLINNITTAAADQADMIAQISETLLTTATTVQNNSKFAHESAATAEELNSQAEMLQSLVNYFKL